MELTKPGLDILQPAWKDRAPASVDALFTCRDGGVSSGAYGNAEGIMGLNVAPHTGDFGACVRMNRSIVAQLVPSDPVWLRQVHGTEVVDADTAEGEPEADASVSTKPGVVCTVMTADCLDQVLANRLPTRITALAGQSGDKLVPTDLTLKKRAGTENCYDFSATLLTATDSTAAAQVSGTITMVKEDGRWKASAITLNL